MSDKIANAPIDEIVPGKWVYRSFRNNPNVDTEFNELEFGRGLITFGTVAYDQIYDSELDMGGGYKLSLKGEIVRHNGEVRSIQWRGDGISGTPTEGWIYDYDGVLVKRWPEGVDQAQVIVGSVIRTVQHGEAPAGYVGSFYMVKIP